MPVKGFKSLTIKEKTFDKIKKISKHQNLTPSELLELFLIKWENIKK